MINVCLPCHPMDCSLVALMDTYRLRRNQQIPSLCVILSHLSDDNCFCQKVGLESPTQAHL